MKLLVHDCVPSNCPTVFLPVAIEVEDYEAEGALKMALAFGHDAHLEEVESE